MSSLEYCSLHLSCGIGTFNLHGPFSMRGKGKGLPFGLAYGNHTLPGGQGLSKSVPVVPETLPPVALFVSEEGGRIQPWYLGSTVKNHKQTLTLRCSLCTGKKT